jgi:hypothetical protein
MIAILVQAIRFTSSDTFLLLTFGPTWLIAEDGMIVFATRRVQNQCPNFLLQQFLLFNHLNRMQGAAQWYIS